MPFHYLQKFIKFEAKSSLLLLLAALLAIVVSNSRFSQHYLFFINYPLTVDIQVIHLESSLKLFVNEVLMTFFFFLIGLEIKREVLIGKMSSGKKILLPFIASISGILMAALTYLIINGTASATTHGWAIPTATDVALSSAVLILLGKSIPTALRLFLTILAIIDDVIAAAIIAIFYSNNFHILFLLLAILCTLLLFLSNRIAVYRFLLSVVMATLLWLCIYAADISPAVAGVLIAFTIPLKGKNQNRHQQQYQHSTYHRLEAKLHPWVAFVILPIFVFVNAGLSFEHLHLAMFFEPLTLGIILGLFLGKQIGIFGSCWLAVKAKMAYLPEGIRWQQFYGMSVLCGIGFTMNLFIGFLAFPPSTGYFDLVKLGILTASSLSAVVGYGVLRLSRINDNNKSR